VSLLLLLPQDAEDFAVELNFYEFMDVPPSPPFSSLLYNALGDPEIVDHDPEINSG
jgi:hypothetical protein